MISKRLAVILTLVLLLSSTVEGKRVCNPTFRTKALVAGGAFAGTFAATMVAAPVVLGMARVTFRILNIRFETTTWHLVNNRLQSIFCIFFIEILSHHARF